MKNITFNNIRVEGFGSFITDRTFQLQRDGIHILRGFNGAGKTTLFNALFWGLYGENLKGVVQSKLPTLKKYRTKEWRGTRVAISITVDEKKYLIVRHISFTGTTSKMEGGSKLMIFESGKLLSDELHKSDMQSYINETLGLDSKAFLSSILFGQRMKRFIEASPAEKRTIFESIFEADFVELAKENAKSYMTDLESEHTSNKIKFDNNSNRIETLGNQESKYKELLKSFEDSRKERIEGKQTSLKSEKSNLKKLEKELEEFLTSQKELQESIEKKKLEVNNQTELQEKIRIKERELDTISNNINSTIKEIKTARNRMDSYELEITTVKETCPSCTQPLPKEKIETVKKSIQIKIDSEREVIVEQEKNEKVLSKNLDTCKKEVEKLKSKLDTKVLQEFKDCENELSDVNSDIKVTNANIENSKKNIKNLETDIESIENENPPKLDLKSIEKEIKDLKFTNKELESRQEVLLQEKEDTDWWIKKGFGSGGLKSFIFNAMLNLLNKSIVKYASRLGFLVQFSIDMEKASKPFLTKCFNADKVELDYEEFSGGEKARIDIATAFAIHDVVSTNSNINILIMDEIFEGLDESGIEDAFDLMRLKAEGKTLYVITHSKNIDSLNCKHIDLIKENNNTLID